MHDYENFKIIALCNFNCSFIQLIFIVPNAASSGDTLGINKADKKFFLLRSLYSSFLNIDSGKQSPNLRNKHIIWYVRKW